MTLDLQERIARALAWLDGCQYGATFAILEAKQDATPLHAEQLRLKRACRKFGRTAVGRLSGCGAGFKRSARCGGWLSELDCPRQECTLLHSWKKCTVSLGAPNERLWNARFTRITVEQAAAALRTLGAADIRWAVLKNQVDPREDALCPIESAMRSNHPVAVYSYDPSEVDQDEEEDEELCES